MSRESLASVAVEGVGTRLVRVPPAGDVFPFVESAAARGSALILTPSINQAVALAGRLRRAHWPVASVPREWAAAAAGRCTVVGARAAAWAPVPDLAAVLVVDAHDESYQEERSPTWSAVHVAVERARRAGVPCALLSSCPTPELLVLGPLHTPDRMTERSGWAVVDVVDRRRDDPATGLYSERFVAVLRGSGRIACILNRKGRARLLACASCGELARCERCAKAVAQADDLLRCRSCGWERPRLCAACGASRLKTLRAGVTRVGEELAALGRTAVGEVTATTEEVPGARVLVGTEALLHRLAPGEVDVVAFLDFDQELLAPRYRAGEQALALMARAARVVGGRPGRVLVQTRVPRHEVIDAALHGDPGRFTATEQQRRQELGLPPASALAVVAGSPGAELVEALSGVEVADLGEERWLLRAPDHNVLCDALARVRRPVAGLRIEVDPRNA